MTNILTNFALFIKALHRPAHDAQIAILLLIFRAVEDLGQWHSSELQVFGNGSIELVLQQLMKKETVDFKKNKEDEWGSSKGEKEREEICNYITISKIKENLKPTTL